MIDVSQIVNTPEFAQDYTILRSAGSWLNGVWILTTTPLAGFGVVSIAEPNDVMMNEAGDIIKGEMVFHSDTPIFTTSALQGRSSDIITWNGTNYRILQVGPYRDYGYYRAVGVRMTAAG
jgi:hypothetical protein